MNLERCVLLRPVDRVYFGPPRSQVAGEQHGGRSEFPPSPFAIAGMLRTHLLEGAEPALDLEDWTPSERRRRAALVGTADKLPKDWQMVGPFPAQATDAQSKLYEPWLRVPAWVTWGMDRQWHSSEVLAAPEASVAPSRDRRPTTMADDDDAFGNGMRTWIGSPRVRRRTDLYPQWIPARLLKRLLSSSRPVGGLLEQVWHPGPFPSREPPFVRREIAPGIAIHTSSGTAKDGMLYSLEMLRFAPGSGLLVWFDAQVTSPLRLSSLDGGVGRAGRKGQMAAFESAYGRVAPAWKELLDDAHLDWAEAGASFWVYLATPVRVTDPLRDGLAAIRALAPRGISVSLLAAAAGEPQVIGGLRLDGGKPRQNGLYAPAGSGWLVRIEADSVGSRTEFLRSLHGRCSMGPEDERAFGFGFTLVGRGPLLPESQVESAPRIQRRERSMSE